MAKLDVKGIFLILMIHFRAEKVHTDFIAKAF